MVKLKGQPVDVCIIKIYMPPTEHNEEQVDDMYEKIERTISLLL